MEALSGSPGPPPLAKPQLPRPAEVASGTLYIVAGLLAWGSLWTLSWSDEGIGPLRPFLAGVAMLAAAVLFFVTGHAIRRRRPWAWRATFLLACAGVAGGLAIAVFGAATMAWLVVTTGWEDASVLVMPPLVGALLAGASVFVLRSFGRPETRLWFGRPLRD